MKRSGPPPRRTPLRPGKPMARSAPIGRTKPGRASPAAGGARPAKPTPKRKTSSGFSASVKREALERDGYRCQAAHVWPGVRCGGGLHVHHVRIKGRRGAPDNTLANALTICAVHHTHAHDVDRAGAERAGIIVRSLS